MTKQPSKARGDLQDNVEDQEGWRRFQRRKNAQCKRKTDIPGDRKEKRGGVLAGWEKRDSGGAKTK